MGPWEIVSLLVWIYLFGRLIWEFFRSIRIVPTKFAYIVERLGRYDRTLGPGLHVLLPFLEKVTFVVDQREETIIVPPQECFTKDNVKVEVDGVVYVSVVDPVAAAYGVTDYRFAATQLGQTTTRSVIGTLELDQTFEERDLISTKVVEALSDAGADWGIRVHRYEVKNIVPPATVRGAMEQQMSAERERRAVIARSEGDKLARINRSEGLRREMINKSEGEMRARVNEALGRAREIEALAEATAQSIEKIAESLSEEGGDLAVKLQLTQQYLGELGKLAQRQARVILPADLTSFDSLLDGLGLSVDGPPMRVTPELTGELKDRVDRLRALLADKEADPGEVRRVLDAILARGVPPELQTLEGYLLLGRAEHRVGDYHDAKRWFMSARELAPEDRRVAAYLRKLARLPGSPAS